MAIVLYAPALALNQGISVFVLFTNDSKWKEAGSTPFPLIDKAQIESETFCDTLVFGTCDSL